MKAEPQLPTSSAAAVAQIGAQSVAAALQVPRGRVSVPLAVGAHATGLPVLVHRETGQVMGICATADVAARVQRALA